MPIPIQAHCALCPQCGWEKYFPGSPSDAVTNPNAIAPDRCPECGHSPLEIKHPCSPSEGLVSLFSNLFGHRK